eukprot:GHVU01036305.1.p2 GENE.GHVU01036305.1~~GHVU01036305.1.p2  ORF type:complete len:139 (+),score=21.74 GHVU01036305.1:970-1386(+)
MHGCAGSFRINMGNLLYGAGRYQQALKLYKIALDEAAVSEDSLRLQLHRNIGNTYFRLGQPLRAVEAYVFVLAHSSDWVAGVNLLLSTLIVAESNEGTTDQIQEAFSRFVALVLATPGTPLRTDRVHPRSQFRRREDS